jgi:hypothetical protein
MGEEYPEEDAGDARGVVAKNCSFSGANRGVGARSGELEETTEVSSGCTIKGTVTMEGGTRHYKR